MNEVLRRLLFLPDQASTFARDFDQLHPPRLLGLIPGGGAAVMHKVFQCG